MFGFKTSPDAVKMFRCRCALAERRYISFDWRQFPRLTFTLEEKSSVSSRRQSVLKALHLTTMCRHEITPNVSPFGL